MALLENMNEQLTRTRTMGTRDALVRQVRDIIQSASSYSYTLGQQDLSNATFKLCMEGAVPPALCIAKDPADQPLTYGVSFYGVGGTQAVSGGLGNPAKYNADGTKCDPQNQGNCPLEVETWFQPICNLGKSCQKADDLLVFFSVRSSANAKYQVKTISNIGTPTAYSSLTQLAAEPPRPEVLTGSGGGGAGGNLTCFNAAKVNGWGVVTDVPLCCTMIGQKVACAQIMNQPGGEFSGVVQIPGPNSAQWKYYGYTLDIPEDTNQHIAVGPLNNRRFELEVFHGLYYMGACPNLMMPCQTGIAPLSARLFCSIDAGVIGEGSMHMLPLGLNNKPAPASLKKPKSAKMMNIYECKSGP
jgi:hypothetical protein